MKVLRESNFGIKVVDEAHLHLKGVLKFDAICNIKHNWYLSATLGRSDPLEDSVLNRALLDADRFIGNGTYEEYQHEYVNIYLQDIYYNPPNKLCEETLKFGTKGLIVSTYYNMLMQYRDGIPFVNNIINQIKIGKGICSYGKILVLIPLLKIINVVIDKMKKDSYFSSFSIASIDGSMSLREKRKALDNDIILSTTASVGTGTDIADLAVVINFDQKKSPITNEQIFGRNRTRKDDRDCFYIDVCDHVKRARSLEMWGRQRRMILPYFPGAKSNIKVLPTIRC